MPSNKDRLYVALYPSGVVDSQERKYHWAFIIGPKAERADVVPGARYHVKNGFDGWRFEEMPLVNVKNTNSLLVRILIAKIIDEDRLVKLFRELPVVQNDPRWRCRTWLESALIQIAKDGKCVGTAELDWQKIEAVARQYAQDKTATGRYKDAAALAKPKPTWNMLENKEDVV